MMKGITDFIVQIDIPYNEKYQTENGTEFYLDKRWSVEKLANKKAVVVNLPFEHNSPIKIGYNVIIDPTILYEQIYSATGGVQESVFLVDKEKGLYKIKESMILMYQENSDCNWVGHADNVILEKIEQSESEKPLKSQLIIVPEVSKKKYAEDRFKIAYCSNHFEADKNDVVMVTSPHYLVDLDLFGSKFLWTKAHNIIAKVA